METENDDQNNHYRRRDRTKPFDSAAGVGTKPPIT